MDGGLIRQLWQIKGDLQNSKTLDYFSVQDVISGGPLSVCSITGDV